MNKVILCIGLASIFVAQLCARNLYLINKSPQESIRLEAHDMSALVPSQSYKVILISEPLETLLIHTTPSESELDPIQITIPEKLQNDCFDLIVSLFLEKEKMRNAFLALFLGQKFSISSFRQTITLVDSQNEQHWKNELEKLQKIN